MKKYRKIGLFIFLIFAGLTVINSQSMPSAGIPKPPMKIQTATLAGGCYWSMQAAFEKLDGLESVVAGYAEGSAAGKSTGKVEAVQITYDPQMISYTELLDYYWKQFDPTDRGGSFYDRGPQYKSNIFYHNKRQELLAETSRTNLDQSGIFKKAIVTGVAKFERFSPVQDSEQDYYKKNPDHYARYCQASGRDNFLQSIWGDLTTDQYHRPTEQEIKRKLTDLQVRVTQKAATERAFDNAYWKNEREGIYVDVVSGEPLFSSSDKFESGTGWPSFTRPIDPRFIVRRKDYSLFTERIEIRSRIADSHLGHVFMDGPAPTYLRYCMNSAALRFIPRDQMKEQGYGDWFWVFEVRGQ
jgi:peptide methionine sulfoxide reductase msrA/msrB